MIVRAYRSSHKAKELREGGAYYYNESKLVDLFFTEGEEEFKEYYDITNHSCGKIYFYTIKLDGCISIGSIRKYISFRKRAESAKKEISKILKYIRFKKFANEQSEQITSVHYPFHDEEALRSVELRLLRPDLITKYQKFRKIEEKFGGCNYHPSKIYFEMWGRKMPNYAINSCTKLSAAIDAEIKTQKAKT